MRGEKVQQVLGPVRNSVTLYPESCRERRRLKWEKEEASLGLHRQQNPRALSILKTLHQYNLKPLHYLPVLLPLNCLLPPHFRPVMTSNHVLLLQIHSHPLPLLHLPLPLHPRLHLCLLQRTMVPPPLQRHWRKMHLERRAVRRGSQSQPAPPQRSSLIAASWSVPGRSSGRQLTVCSGGEVSEQDLEKS